MRRSAFGILENTPVDPFLAEQRFTVFCDVLLRFHNFSMDSAKLAKLNEGLRDAQFSDYYISSAVISQLKRKPS